MQTSQLHRTPREKACANVRDVLADAIPIAVAGLATTPPSTAKYTSKSDLPKRGDTRDEACTREMASGCLHQIIPCASECAASQLVLLTCKKRIKTRSIRYFGCDAAVQILAAIQQW